MRKRDIEKALIDSADTFVPDCLELVLEKTKYIIPHQKNVVKKTKLSFGRRFAIAFSIIFIMVIGGTASFFGVMSQDYQTIYLDINPSMAVVIDRFEKVKEVVYINDDAENLFSDYKPKGKSIDEVMKKFIDECESNGIINENDTLYISSYSKNQKDADKILNKLNNNANKIFKEKNKNLNIENEKITKEEKKNAEKQKTSPAKLRLINEIINLTEDNNLEDLKEMTMKELKKLIEDLENTKPSDSDDFQNPDNGLGQQNGRR